MDYIGSRLEDMQSDAIASLMEASRETRRCHVCSREVADGIMLTIPTGYRVTGYGLQRTITVTSTYEHFTCEDDECVAEAALDAADDLTLAVESDLIERISAAEANEKAGLL